MSDWLICLTMPTIVIVALVAKHFGDRYVDRMLTPPRP
jgi:hypothetical protein